MIDLSGADALLMMDDSERNADLFYATGFRAPDPFSYIWTASRSYLLTGDLELDRARSQARVDEVLSSSHYRQLLGAPDSGDATPQAYQILERTLQELELRHLRVPAHFPVALADYLRQVGFELEAMPSPLFPQRAIKTEEEIAAIGAALEAAEAGMAVAAEALRRSRIVGDLLHLDGEVLTSERIRRLIHHTLLDLDGTASDSDTIVACGDQGCDPHQVGHGPLAAGRTIIIDIFPRSSITGYYGDLTRTFVKGSVPEPVQALYDTVRRGQELALPRICDGADARAIHREIQEFFAAAGYETGEHDGHRQGFFHGTGHGLGLEIHEAPGIGDRDETLRAGHVVTVEPGLYYPGLGGVRLEDLVVVGEDGARNLTTSPLEPAV